MDLLCLRLVVLLFHLAVIQEQLLPLWLHLPLKECDVHPRECPPPVQKRKNEFFTAHLSLKHYLDSNKPWCRVTG